MHCPAHATRGGARWARWWCCRARKRREYVLPGGKALTPFGVETFGRLGPAAEELLSMMQAASANRSRLRGGHANRIIERLRERIDAHLHRHAGHMCALAEHGLGGSAPYRKVPMDADGVMAGILPAMLRDTPEVEPFHCAQPHSCQYGAAAPTQHRCELEGPAKARQRRIMVHRKSRR